MKTPAPPPSSKTAKRTRQRTLQDRDAAEDVQGPEARKRLAALASAAFAVPYEKVRALEKREKGKSGRGRKPKGPKAD